MTTAGHYAVCRPVRLSWFENDHGEWHWLHTDDGLWEVICAQCGDRDGPPEQQEAEIRQLRGPYPHEQAREVVIYHSAGGVHPELLDADRPLGHSSWVGRPADAYAGTDARPARQTFKVDLMARHSSLRSQLYRAARDLGNVQAMEWGPTAYTKRVVRRKVYRNTNSLTRKLTRELGL